MSEDATNRVDVAELYARHAPFVLRRVLRFFPRDEAEEVAHEVFVKVLAQASSFRAESSPTTWLYRMVTNHCIDAARDLEPGRELWQPQGETVWTWRLPEDELETTLFVREFWRSLEPELVQVGFHYFVDGLTHAEIARLMDVSPGTVVNRLEQLRDQALERADLSESSGESEPAKA